MISEVLASAFVSTRPSSSRAVLFFASAAVRKFLFTFLEQLTSTNKELNMFGHEKFKAYELSISFLADAMKLLDQLPSGNAHIRDQLKRAASSIPLNLAEGSGKMSNKDKLRFYSIARGSAMECAAICDVLVLTEPRFRKSAESAKATLEQITRILTTICSKT